MTGKAVMTEGEFISQILNKRLDSLRAAMLQAQHCAALLCQPRAPIRNGW